MVLPSLLILVERRRISVRAFFVDQVQLAHDELDGYVSSGLWLGAGRWAHVVVSAKEDEQGAHGRGQKEEPVLGKDVFFQSAGTVPSANAVLVLLVIAVQRCEVDVGRGLVDRGVLVVGAEDGVDDKCRKREEERGEACGVRSDLLRTMSLGTRVGHWSVPCRA
jgi:hypothetical protein